MSRYTFIAWLADNTLYFLRRLFCNFLVLIIAFIHVFFQCISQWLYHSHTNGKQIVFFFLETWLLQVSFHLYFYGCEVLHKIKAVIDAKILLTEMTAMEKSYRPQWYFINYFVQKNTLSFQIFVKKYLFSYSPTFPPSF